MTFVSFFIEHQWVFLFYAVLIATIILLRKKIEWQVFGIGLYKTKVGIKLMENWGTKYRGFVRLLGFIGIGVGFAGMVFIMASLFQGFYNLLTNPAAPAVISPVVPGFNIPGVGLKVPLITGWLALFVVIVIHEFSHGVVSRAHNVPVKSSGLLIFGPLGGAFVEPDEKKLLKEDITVQYSLFAAGPFSNIIAAIIFTILLSFIIAPVANSMTTPAGVEITAVTPNYPAANASLQTGMVITGVNNVAINDNDALTKSLDAVRPGEAVTIKTDKGDYVVITTQNPSDLTSNKGYLGINLKAKRNPNIIAQWYTALLAVVNWIKEFFQWIILLSLGIGLANLLPIGPVDGGRMLQQACRQVTGDEKNGGRGDWWWKKISLFTFVLIIILLFIPIIKAVI